jgi:hypothetical protein
MDLCITDVSHCERSEAIPASWRSKVLSGIAHHLQLIVVTDEQVMQRFQRHILHVML